MLSLKLMIGLCPILLFSTNSIAQDAWLLDDFYTQGSKKEEKKRAKTHYKKDSALYQIDINGDIVREYIGTSIVDGIPTLQIYDVQKRLIFSYRFPISGFNSHIYRIKRRKISENKTATLFYQFNGNTNYINTYGSSNLWGIVVENGKLDNIKIHNFGQIWQENKDNYGLYKRAHLVNFMDVNNDGQLDVVISSGSVYKAYSHVNGSEWSQTYKK
ncbi:hypothetical protein ABMA70_06795 [Halobacteriovorax sp. XZX-3]|uniref:hypothetical protein n=1 Tax=unclassified Halobacteriovorax TaxID=2639665 RepID=UPI0037165977